MIVDESREKSLSITKQFDRHALIMVGELHRWEQLHAFIREMVRDRLPGTHQGTGNSSSRSAKATKKKLCDHEIQWLLAIGLILRGRDVDKL